MKRNKKPKVVMVGNTPIAPISNAERERIAKCVAKKYEAKRRRYPEIHGKKVDWIEHWYEEGCLFFNVRFTDGKEFSISCRPTVYTHIVDYCDMSSGDMKVLRTYYRRKGGVDD